MKLKRDAWKIYATEEINRLNENHLVTNLEDWMIVSQSAKWINTHKGEDVELVEMTMDRAVIRIGERVETVYASMLE